MPALRVWRLSAKVIAAVLNETETVTAGSMWSASARLEFHALKQEE